MQWAAYGPRSVLIRFGHGDDHPETLAMARAISRALEGRHCASIADYALAFDQVLIELKHPEGLEANAGELVEWLGELDPIPAEEAPLHEIPVRYDGEDLEEVAERHDLGMREVVELHAAPIYDVAMLGFSPGFPYLTGLDSRLVTPRRATPRARIPAGSVAIGGRHTGIYSIASPGGWNLIGTTDVRVFDPRRPGDDGDEEAMFLLRTGDRVKFVPINNHGD